MATGDGTQDVDGGYYAIRGFVYQFNKAIVMALQNPTDSIAVEYKQDINFQDLISRSNTTKVKNMFLLRLKKVSFHF